MERVAGIEPAFGAWEAPIITTIRYPRIAIMCQDYRGVEYKNQAKYVVDEWKNALVEPIVGNIVRCARRERGSCSDAVRRRFEQGLH